ncbi:MAG TPA: dienelactone hydrolase family protein [Gemmatimonadaceae bacterium]
MELRSGNVVLHGTLGLPDGAQGVILFAHGSGSGRLSPRNNYVAHVLQDVGLATLLIDLLTREEEIVDARTAHLRFDIDFLAGRLLDATRWLVQTPETAGLAVGYFGASTGAAAALQAAAAGETPIFAVVSRGGRPDLAMPYLADVHAPTLLIVGGNDAPVIPLNRVAYDALRTEKEMRIVPGATHLFEEPGALETVAELASDWFVRYLRHAREE